MLKTTFPKSEPKRLIYRDYSSFSNDIFAEDLSASIQNVTNFTDFESKAIKVINKHAPKKTKMLR